jgi:divalent metal cation (Fe/Co/Zn/Cd) transporter
LAKSKGYGKERKHRPISLGINLLLVVIKYTLTVVAGSAALLADAIHSFSDAISSATMVADIKISKRNSRRFHFGGCK